MGGGGGGAFTWYITLYTILVQKWGVGAYMVMGVYKVLYSNITGIAETVAVQPAGQSVCRSQHSHLQHVHLHFSAPACSSHLAGLQLLTCSASALFR